MMRLALIIVIVLGLTPVVGLASQVQVADEVRTLLEEKSRRPFEQIFSANPYFSHVERMYFVRDYRPLWHNNSPDSIAAFLEQIRDSGQDALDVNNYQTDAIESLADSLLVAKDAGVEIDTSVVALNDILITSVLFHYAADMFGHRSYVLNDDNQSEWDRWYIKFILAYRYSDTGGDVSDLATALIPQFSKYLALREKMKGYSEISQIGGWQSIPRGKLLREGMKDRRLSAIRQRLFLSGDLKNESGSLRYGRSDVSAVKRFQRRHGLKDDGVFGDNTRRLMNVSVEKKIVSIGANLERFRWLPRNLPGKRIEVNIADFSLDYFNKSQHVLEMPVIVGTIYRKTPLFSALMTYIDFSPSWHVPPTIFKEDLLPKIKKNPDYLKKNGYELVSWNGNEVYEPSSVDWQRMTAKNVPGFLRKKPGPYNPLGRVKFMFPNRFAIYLHDTPNKSLFNKKDRTLSSGCIRVKRPFELARYILQDQDGWGESKIKRAMSRTDSPVRVVLSNPVEVFILYETAWVDESGILQFREDVYGRDDTLVRLLQQKSDQLAYK